MAKGWSLQIALKAAGLPESLVTPAMAAEYLGLHLTTIYGWVKTGRVKAWGTRWGNRYYVDLAEILQPIEPDAMKIAPVISKEEWRKRRSKGAAVSATVARKRMAQLRHSKIPPEPTE